MAKKIPAGRAKVGDVLAEPVVHGEGQMLLTAGTVVMSQHLEMLRQRGVLLVTIEDEESGDVATEHVPLDPDELKKVVIEEGRWFGEARKHPIMAEVFRWVVKQKSTRSSNA